MLRNPDISQGGAGTTGKGCSGLGMCCLSRGQLQSGLSLAEAPSHRDTVITLGRRDPFLSLSLQDMTLHVG